MVLIIITLGHTHEDIDAIFGHIWQKLKLSYCTTPEKYRDLIKSALSSTPAKKVEVYDLFTIPDYVSYIKQSLGIMAKLSYTSDIPNHFIQQYF